MTMTNNQEDKQEQFLKRMESLVVRLENLFNPITTQQNTQLRDDAISALQNLGYKVKDVQPIIENIVSTYPDASMEIVMRTALNKLSKGS